MSLIVVLDSGPLGLLANPGGSEQGRNCSAWLESLLASGIRVVIPEIVDYELRRELLRAKFSNSVSELNRLKIRLVYMTLTTEVMLKAAELWAEVRQQGRPTSDDKALDVDVILASQALALADEDNTVVVATTNVGHLERFVEAQLWQDVTLPPPPPQS